MNAYAVAHLDKVTMGLPVTTYLERIDATLAPFGGKFLVHGAALEILEGAFESDVIIVQFPDIDAARAWYQSDAYQAILPLRTDNSEGSVFLVNGVTADHKATDVLT